MQHPAYFKLINIYKLAKIKNMKKLKSILAKNENNIYSFADEFKKIILSQLSNYGETREGLKSFFEDLQQGGCISGMIGEFVYHNDCKNFYVEHIDDLEEFKEDIEEGLGEPIANRLNTKHYTFVVWLCFEEYCYKIYNSVFDN